MSSGISVSCQIGAPAEEVFAKATDFAHAADFISGIAKTEMLTDGPVAAGTRFRETRVMYGRKATEEMEVTSFEPPHGYSLGCESHGCRYHSVLRFTENDSGTEATMTFEATPLTIVAKVMSFLTKPMMKAMAKVCLKDLEDIKAAVEKGG